jgi:hypothetical protein
MNLVRIRINPYKKELKNFKEQSFEFEYKAEGVERAAAIERLSVARKRAWSALKTSLPNSNQLWIKILLFHIYSSF